MAYTQTEIQADLAAAIVARDSMLAQVGTKKQRLGTLQQECNDLIGQLADLEQDISWLTKKVRAG
jgi:cell division protein FtsB